MEDRSPYYDLFSTTGERSDTDDLILSLVLPVSMAGSINMAAMQKFKEENDTYHLSFRHAETIQLLAGSSSDGLCLPDVTEVKGKKRITEGPDEDILYLFTSLVVDSDNKRAFCSTDSSESPPGYTRLVFNHEWLEKRSSKNSREKHEEDVVKSKFQMLIEDNDNFCILRRKLFHILRDHIQDIVRSKDREILTMNICSGMVPTVAFSQHGPALTVERVNNQNPYSEIYSPKDYVIALPCPRWPKEAAEWINRKRVWPSKKFVRSIVKGGCQIVLKGDKILNDPRDFIFSFSYCAKRLALDLSVVQKRCYILFKFFVKYMINKVRRGLTTYHCKTIFFRRCEVMPENKWERHHPLNCLMLLLSDLEGFLCRQFLPDFFIPGMNLIADLSGSVAKAILKDISRVKGDTPKIILEMTRKKRFCWLSVDIHLADILSPLTSGRKYTSELAQEYVCTFLTELLDKGEVVVALSLICDTNNSDVMPSIDSMIKCTERITETNVGKKCVPLIGLLAVLYHERAHGCSESETALKQSFFEKSHWLFNDVKHNIGKHTWIIGEYFNILSKMQEEITIIRDFQKFSDDSLFEGGIYTTIAAHNAMTVDLALQVIGEFSVPSIIYIAYKTVFACVRISQTVKKSEKIMLYARRLSQRMCDWLRRKESLYPEDTDEYCHILLGLCFKETGDVKNFERNFTIAENFNRSFGPRGDDIFEIQPLTKDIEKASERKEGRFHPYRSRRRLRNNVDLRGLKFRCKEFRLNPFIHN